MYSVYVDDLCIYNSASPLESMKISSPILSLEDNSAGSFSFIISKNNIGYDKIKCLVTDITIFEDEEEIWSGRILSEEMDFWKNKNYYCEGEYAFLNDSTQPQAEYHNMTIKGFLEKLIEIHNSKVGENRRFQVGEVTVKDSNDSIYRYTNYETTMECINSKLVNKLGGHIRIRKSGKTRIIDYLADYPNQNNQTIEIGKNLLDFTETWEHSDYATVILPLGARLEESPIDALEAYQTVESVNGGSMFVKSDNAVQTYGWIEKVVHWDDVTTPSALLTKAKEYLSDLQFDNISIKISAIDLHCMNVQFERIKMLDQVRVVSVPHGMDRYFPVNQLEIHLDAPEESKLTLGSNVRSTLTYVSGIQNEEIQEKFDSVPKMSAVIKEIKQRATDIMNSTVTGYITIVHGNDRSEALYCTDTPDYKKAMKMWRLSMAGFGYSDNGGNDWKIAITMDGRINADFITSGTMNANIIRAGVLKDANSNVVFDLENGTLSIKKGSINLGNGNFSVSTDGYLTSTSGQIGGFTIGTESLYSDDIELSKYRVAFKQYGAYVGEIRGIRLPTNDTNRGVVLNLGYGQAVIGMSIGTSWSNDGFDPILLYFDRDVIAMLLQEMYKEPLKRFILQETQISKVTKHTIFGSIRKAVEPAEVFPGH